MSEPFIGEIRIFGFNFAPRSWAFCNGQLLPIAQNTALFSILGTTFGGDGRSTMGLPNLQSRAPMHPGRGPGLTARNLGENAGGNTITLSTAQIPNHTHTLRGAKVPGTVSTPINNTSAMTGFPDPEYNTAGTNLVDMSSDGIANTGGGQPHENRQPFLAVSFCIALQGLYPSRS